MKVLIITALYIGCLQASTVSCVKLGQDFSQAADKAMPDAGGINCEALNKSIALLRTVKTSCTGQDVADANELLNVLPKVYDLKCKKEM